MKKVLIGHALCLIVLLSLTASQCNSPEGWDHRGPMKPYLTGMWKLVKVITPTDTLTGSQIGYKEVLSYSYEHEMGYDSTFRNDAFFAVHLRLDNPVPVLNDDDMTILMYYQGDLQRFHKINRTDYVTTLEASDYLKEVGSDADSVKYIYSRF